MSAQPLRSGPSPQQSALELQSTGNRRSTTAGVQSIILLIAFGILCIAPGIPAMSYRVSCWIAEGLIGALCVYVTTKRIRTGNFAFTAVDGLAIAWALSEIAGTCWAYIDHLGSHSPYYGDLFYGGALGPIRMMIDTLAGIAAYFVARGSAGKRSTVPIYVIAAFVLVLCGLEEARNVLYGTDDPRLQACFTNPNLLGAFLCMAVSFITATALANWRARKVGAAVGMSLFAVLLGVSLALAQSRGAMIGGAIGVGFTVAATLLRKRTTLSGRKALIGGVLAAAVVVAGAMIVFPHLLHEPRNASDGQRMVAWEAGALIAAHHPLFGTGVDSFPASMAALHLKEFNPETANGLPKIPAVHLHAHDLLLQAWVERGLAGGLSVLALLYFVGRRAGALVTGRAGNGSLTIAIGATGAVIACLTQTFVDYTIWFAPVGIIFWYFAGLMFTSAYADNCT